MLRWISALVIAGLLTAAALLLLTGDFPQAGRVVWRPDYGHGFRIGEILVVCGWAVGMVATVVLLRRPRPTGARTEREALDEAAEWITPPGPRSPGSP